MELQELIDRIERWKISTGAEPSPSYGEAPTSNPRNEAFSAAEVLDADFMEDLEEAPSEELLGAAEDLVEESEEAEVDAPDDDTDNEEEVDAEDFEIESEEISPDEDDNKNKDE